MKKRFFLILMLAMATFAAGYAEEAVKTELSAAEEAGLPAAETVEPAVQQEQSVVTLDLTSQEVKASMENMARIETDSKKAAMDAKFGAYKPLNEFEITTVPLVAFGLIAKANKKDFRAARNNFIPSYENRFDDFLQHVPLLMTTGFNIAGYEGRSSLWRYLVSGGLSYATMGVLTNGIKYTAKEMRPDGSTANSFPSGHTATAFVAATIMHKEYGLTRSPWWSVFGYACATTTGIMRTLNNRHWISDVLVGAGIGVISTDIGYMIGDYIFKKKGIKREPRKGDSDMLENPSFFKLSLGMQMTNDIKMPTYAEFQTTQRLWTAPGAAELSDDYYLVVREGNPFSIPDNFNAPAGKRTYDNYLRSKPGNQGGSQIYQNPRVKVGMGTTVGAEAAYFINKYVGVGARARITTAPAYAEGLSCYNGKQQLMPSASVTDVWSMADVNAGIYLAWPINSHNNVNVKALYGRRFFGSLDLQAAYDANFMDTKTYQVYNYTMYGDDLYIANTNSDDLALGLSYTYSLNNGVAISGFFDFDYSKPEFDVEYSPYHTDMTKMAATSSFFSYKQKITSFTLGASMTVLF